MKRFLFALLFSSALFAQNDTYFNAVVMNNKNFHQVPWQTIVIVPKLFWFEWGTVQVSYPIEISAVQEPSCVLTDLDAQDQRLAITIVLTERKGVTIKARRGHRINFDCKGWVYNPYDSNDHKPKSIPPGLQQIFENKARKKQ